MVDSQFPKLVELMARLRSPDGCPWDREQTFDTIKPFLLEETYEVVDAIARRDWDELAGELGDLMLQVVFFAQMAKEEGRFDIEDVIERIHTKMMRRHPHVFGDAKADTAADVLRNWEKLKAAEKQQQAAQQGREYEAPKSVLEGVSSSIPSVMEAYQLSSRAAHVGFDWKRLEDLFDKLREEMRELAAEAGAPADAPVQQDKQSLSGPSEAESASPAAAPPGGGSGRGGTSAGAGTDANATQFAGAMKDPVRFAALEDEVGDLLFTAVNVARFLKVDPESALRKTNRKFRDRFQWMERELAQAGRSPRDASLEELDALWSRSKT